MIDDVPTVDIVDNHYDGTRELLVEGQASESSTSVPEESVPPVYDWTPIPDERSVQEVKGSLVVFYQAQGARAAVTFPVPEISVCVVEHANGLTEFL